MTTEKTPAMNTTQVQLADHELAAIGDAADHNGWTFADNETCLELQCVGTGDLLGLWSRFILSVERRGGDLADRLAESCRLVEDDYSAYVEFPTIAAPES